MRRLLAFGLLAVIAAGCVVAAGLVPIQASSRHWAITSFVLDFTKRRSVATHSIGIRTPALDDAALVLKGAGHYETGCQPCHGSPRQRPPSIPSGMTPHPPDLQQQVSRWKPRELFYIVKHGIKFTGMPAWPAAARDDEIWAVVAFLRTLPDTDASEYARLVDGDAAGDTKDSPPRDVAGTSAATISLVRSSCARCHGMNGEGRERAAFPRLAGQRSAYLKQALEAYANRSRHSGTMTPIAAGMTAQTMRAAAEYYAGLAPARGAAGGAAATRGAEIAARGIPARRVPPCAECHGPAATKRNAAYPRLAGQFGEYLSLQLRLFAEDRRGGSEYGHIMRKVASGLTVEQMDDAAAYYASLPPEVASPASDR